MSDYLIKYNITDVEAYSKALLAGNPGESFAPYLLGSVSFIIVGVNDMLMK